MTGTSLEARAGDVSAWTIDELKDEMFKLANKDHNVLKPLNEIPVSSYGDHSRYQKVLEEGKKRAINFNIAHDYLVSALLRQ